MGRLSTSRALLVVLLGVSHCLGEPYPGKYSGHDHEHGHGWMKLHGNAHHEQSSKLSEAYVKFHGLDAGNKGGGGKGNIFGNILNSFSGGNMANNGGGGGGGWTNQGQEVMTLQVMAPIAMSGAGGWGSGNSGGGSRGPMRGGSSKRGGMSGGGMSSGSSKGSSGGGMSGWGMSGGGMSGGGMSGGGMSGGGMSGGGMSGGWGAPPMMMQPSNMEMMGWGGGQQQMQSQMMAKPTGWASSGGGSPNQQMQMVQMQMKPVKGWASGDFSSFRPTGGSSNDKGAFSFELPQGKPGFIQKLKPIIDLPKFSLKGLTGWRR